MDQQSQFHLQNSPGTLGEFKRRWRNGRLFLIGYQNSVIVVKFWNRL